MFFGCNMVIETRVFFFHQRVKNRKSKNYGKGITNQAGPWVKDDRDVESSVLNYFEDLFRGSHYSGSDEVFSSVGTRVTGEMNVNVHKDVTQFRPISLCNVVYKIVSKVMANRLKLILTQIISLAQSAFVFSRHISDNSLLVSEISNFL